MILGFTKRRCFCFSWMAVTDVVPKSSWQLAEPGSGRGRSLILMAGRGPALPGCPRCPRVRAEASDVAFQPRVPRPQLQHSGVCTHLPVCPREGVSKSRGQMPAPLEPTAAAGRQRSLGGLLTGGTRALLAWLLFQASSPSAHSLPGALAPLPQPRTVQRR